MKIYVSADMEGVCGVTHSAQCRPGHADYDRFRRLLTAEVSAAVEGALEGGADQVLVNDGHFTMTNLVIEELHPAAELITGSNKLLGQMEGIDASFGGVLFVGHHQGDGEGDGVINHTYMSAALRRVRVNGTLVDEVAINARVAGAVAVPVGLVTGDDTVCARAQETLPGVEVAPVKQSIDRLSARHIGVAAARELIAERARAAVRRLASDPPPPVVVDGVARFEVEFRSTSAARFASAFPGVARTGPNEIAFEHEDFLDGFRHFWALSAFGLAVQDGLFGPA